MHIILQISNISLFIYLFYQLVQQHLSAGKEEWEVQRYLSATEAKQSNIQTHSYTLNALNNKGDVLGILCFLAKATDCLNLSTLITCLLPIHENVNKWRKSVREILHMLMKIFILTAIKFGIDNLKKKIYKYVSEFTEYFCLQVGYSLCCILKNCKILIQSVCFFYLQMEGQKT